jgi:hypothetical protein
MRLLNVHFGIWPLTACCTAAQVVLFGAVWPARAEFVIRDARIGQGDLWVSGEVDEPNTIITLDDSFSEKTDENGQFRFRLAYHPATCTVLLKAGQQSRPVVVENCGQRGPAGPPGPATSPLAAGPPPAAPHDTTCGARAALYTDEKGGAVWVTRKGQILHENPLRPLSKERVFVLEVMIAGKLATAYGPDASSLLRGGPPESVEKTFGEKIEWGNSDGAMPEHLQIVESAGEVLARLRFKECGDAPRQQRPEQAKTPPRTPSPDAKPVPRKAPAEVPAREQQAKPSAKPLPIAPTAASDRGEGERKPTAATPPKRPARGAAPVKDAGNQPASEQ